MKLRYPPQIEKSEWQPSYMDFNHNCKQMCTVRDPVQIPYSLVIRHTLLLSAYSLTSVQLVIRTLHLILHFLGQRDLARFLTAVLFAVQLALWWSSANLLPLDARKGWEIQEALFAPLWQVLNYI